MPTKQNQEERKNAKPPQKKLLMDNNRSSKSSSSPFSVSIGPPHTHTQTRSKSTNHPKRRRRRPLDRCHLAKMTPKRAHTHPKGVVARALTKHIFFHPGEGGFNPSFTHTHTQIQTTAVDRIPSSHRESPNQKCMCVRKREGEQ